MNNASSSKLNFLTLDIFLKNNYIYHRFKELKYFLINKIQLNQK